MSKAGKKSMRGRERTSKAPFTGRINFGHEAHPLLRPQRVSSAFNVNATTDLDLLAQTVFSAVEALGFGKDGRLLVGSIASVINRMNVDLRKEIVGHILAGSNLYVNRAVQLNCAKCGREDLLDETHAVSDDPNETSVCSGTPKEEETWVVTTGRFFEPLIEAKDEEAKTAQLWTPGDDL